MLKNIIEITGVIKKLERTMIENDYWHVHNKGWKVAVFSQRLKDEFDDPTGILKIVFTGYHHIAFSDLDAKKPVEIEAVLTSTGLRGRSIKNIDLKKNTKSTPGGIK